MNVKNKMLATQRIILIHQTHPSEGIQKNMHRVLININSVADALIITCRKSAEKILLRETPHRYFG